MRNGSNSVADALRVGLWTFIGAAIGLLIQFSCHAPFGMGGDLTLQSIEDGLGVTFWAWLGSRFGRGLSPFERAPKDVPPFGTRLGRSVRLVRQYFADRAAGFPQRSSSSSHRA